MIVIEERVNDLLNSFGLTRTEQALYLRGLLTDNPTVTDLVESTGVNRTTAYHALSTLKRKGFVTEAKTQGKLVYQMTKPEDLSSYLDRRQATLEVQRQQLKEITNLFPA